VPLELGMQAAVASPAKLVDLGKVEAKFDQIWAKSCIPKSIQSLLWL